MVYNCIKYNWYKDPILHSSPTDYYTRGRPRASGNKQTDYYTRGRPPAPRVTNRPTYYYTRGRPRASGNKQTNILLYPWPPTRASGNKQTDQHTTIPVAAHTRLG